MAIFLTIFTVVMIAVFAITGSEPSVLIASVFAACLGEGSICGMIKKNKNLLESKNECEQIEEAEKIDRNGLFLPAGENNERGNELWNGGDG